jgi:hypothetical protein
VKYKKELYPYKLFKKSFQILKERIGKKNTNLKSQQKKTYQRTINKKKKKDNRVIFKTNKKFHRKQARENVQLNKH